MKKARRKSSPSIACIPSTSARCLSMVLPAPPKRVALINQRRAALVLCPTSNEFLFRRSPSLAFIRSIDAVVLGSDSPLTGAGDLLDEVRFAHTHIGLDANSVYAMVTNRAADVLRLRQGEGRLWPGSVADIVAVRDIGLSPAEYPRSTDHRTN